jgi:SAM domain (Sterile alpha motif)
MRLDRVREASVDVAEWLHGLGLQQYEQAFRENAIDDAVLLELAADDLKDLGVSLVGHRRKLLAAIAALRSESGPEPRDCADFSNRMGGETVIAASITRLSRTWVPNYLISSHRPR